VIIAPRVSRLAVWNVQPFHNWCHQSCHAPAHVCSIHASMYPSATRLSKSTQPTRQSATGLIALEYPNTRRVGSACFTARNTSRTAALKALTTAGSDGAVVPYGPLRV
jgi:hypothetical protein